MNTRCRLGTIAVAKDCVKKTPLSNWRPSVIDPSEIPTNLHAYAANPLQKSFGRSHPSMPLAATTPQRQLTLHNLVILLPISHLHRHKMTLCKQRILNMLSILYILNWIAKNLLSSTQASKPNDRICHHTILFTTVDQDCLQLLQLLSRSPG